MPHRPSIGSSRPHSEAVSVRGDPFAKGACGCAGEVRHRRGHLRGMPDRRPPRGEQHLDGRRRPAAGRLRLVSMSYRRTVWRP